MVTLVTYIYPGGIHFIPSFLKSVAGQTFKDFKLLIFNDGVADPALLFQNHQGWIDIINISGSVTQIRFDSFVYLKDYDADYFVFQDIDDELSEDRIEIVGEYLKTYELVCNDLTTIDSDGRSKMQSIWKKRLGESYEFDYQFILDKNIVGLGNSAIRKSFLDTLMKVTPNAIASDWSIFFQLLYNSKAKAVFTSKCQTLYRQHEGNIAGINVVNKERMHYVLKVKRAHYSGLNEIGIDVESYLLEIENFEERAKTFFNNSFHQPSDLFWWEETKYLYEKN